MYYWGQSRFTGLLAIADALADQAEFKGFADYCRLREQGLRAKAFQVLDDFIQKASAHSEQQQREIAEKLLSLRYENPHVHHLLPDPLLKRFIYPALESWRQAEPQNVAPIRWLGVCHRDMDLFQEALKIEPNDQISCWEMALIHFQGAQWATHHISESVLLSEEGAVFECLAKMEEIIPRIHDVGQRQRLIELHAQELGLMQDWVAFVESGEKDFPMWCDQHGKIYAWSKAYYYKN